MRILLEYSRVTGRVEGTIRAPLDAEPRSFVGTIQLLRLLEEVSEAGDLLLSSDDDGVGR
jgi:hypothetical protein